MSYHKSTCKFNLIGLHCLLKKLNSVLAMLLSNDNVSNKIFCLRFMLKRKLEFDIKRWKADIQVIFACDSGGLIMESRQSAIFVLFVTYIPFV